MRLAVVLCLLVAASSSVACSSSSGGSASDASTDSGAASASDTARPGDDASAAGDAASSSDTVVESDAAETTPSTGCVAKRTPGAAPDCADDCEVRLLLPGGDKYCTTTCAATSACAPLGTGLVCSTEVGTCVPACKTNDECVAAGWKRCDPTTGGCDTM